MDVTNLTLKQYNIVKRHSEGCKCGKEIYLYLLPIKVDLNMVRFLEQMGKSAFDFRKSSILRIENTAFAITGVNGLREIRFTLKKNEKKFLDTFEDLLVEYMKGLNRG
ncbi:MAG: hypothetical protein ACXACY_10350 [Candidatus Hodarchaeales archaeon]|jgi:hypothetical protein